MIGAPTPTPRTSWSSRSRRPQRIGARVEVVTTGELSDPNFARNPADRCYHCKRELYRAAVAEWPPATARRPMLDGTITDDLADHRPGRRAAAEREVRSPLAELGFSKADVRAAADALGLSSAGKPASPCLASRIPYGTEITRENLAQVERAEARCARWDSTKCACATTATRRASRCRFRPTARLPRPECASASSGGAQGAGYPSRSRSISKG